MRIQARFGLRFVYVCSIAHYPAFALETYIMRFLSFLLFLLASTAAFASSSAAPAPPPPSMRGIVADPAGGVVPGAEVDLVDSSGAVAGSFHSDAEGNFQVVAPHPGNFTLVISLPGFETVRTPVVIASRAVLKTASPPNPLLRIVLPIAALSTTVHVNAESNGDLTAGEENGDLSVLSTEDVQ